MRLFTLCVSHSELLRRMRFPMTSKGLSLTSLSRQKEPCGPGPTRMLTVTHPALPRMVGNRGRCPWRPQWHRLARGGAVGGLQRMRAVCTLVARWSARCELLMWVCSVGGIAAGMAISHGWREHRARTFSCRRRENPGAFFWV